MLFIYIVYMKKVSRETLTMLKYVYMQNLLQQIYHTSHLTGDFLLKSGGRSNTYFDKYQFTSDPKLLLAIGKELVKLLPPNTQVIAGLEMGAIPLAVAVSRETGIPSAFIRKQRKQYGTCNYAEGADMTGKNVVIIEDVVTSGSAVIEALEKMHHDQVNIIAVICVIDRQQGGREIIEKLGITFKSLCTMSEILESIA